MRNEQLAISNEQCICTRKKNKTLRSDYKQRNCSLLTAHCSLLFILLFLTGHLYSQENTHTEQVNQIQIQPRFIQHLSWTASEYALRYEVEVEKEENGRYVRFLTERTEESNIHISLPYGNYRFRVIPYDLFDRPGIISEYQYLEVKPAPVREPEIQVPIQTPTAEHFINFYLGASYFTQFHIHGNANWMSAPGQNLNGVSLRLGFVASNLNYFNLGAEIVPAFYSIDSLFNNNDIKSVLGEINLLLQKDLFNRKAAFIVRAGMGITYTLSIDPLAVQNETAFYANMGFSIMWLPAKYFYLEMGANYSYFFAIDYPTARIRPFAGFGTRIGR